MAIKTLYKNLSISEHFDRVREYFKGCTESEKIFNKRFICKGKCLYRIASCEEFTQILDELAKKDYEIIRGGFLIKMINSKKINRQIKIFQVENGEISSLFDDKVVIEDKYRLNKSNNSATFNTEMIQYFCLSRKVINNSSFLCLGDEYNFYFYKRLKFYAIFALKV